MRVIRFLAAPTFIFAGSMHFIVPKWYRRIMPPYIPAHNAMVAASGVAEIAGGAGLLFERTRKPAGCWLIATLIAVFPANLHMALHPDEFQEIPGGKLALYARLPFQGAFIAWVLSAMNR